MVKNKNTNENEISLEFPFNDECAVALSKRPHFDRVNVTGRGLITVRSLEVFKSIGSADTMFIWCRMTRASMRNVISIPGVKAIIIFELKSPGRLAGFCDLRLLERFTAAYGLNEDDFIELSKAPALSELGAQESRLSEDSLQCLLDMPALTNVDFECSNFDDNFARQISLSKRITALEIGATAVTRSGLEAICSMTQLKELDIWATRIDEADIDLLAALPNLEYLSIGGHDEQTVFSADGTLPKLERIRSLKRVWLDGLHVSRAQWDYLNDRYDQVRVTSVRDD